MGKVIALLFHDRGTRKGWVVSCTPRPHFTPGKEPVPIFQEAGWALGPVWTGGKSCPHRDSILDCPARSQSLYQLSYLAYSSSLSTYCQSISIITNCTYATMSKSNIMTYVNSLFTFSRSAYDIEFLFYTCCLLSIFHLDCTRWCRSTSLVHISKKFQCCWRGNYMSSVYVKKHNQFIHTTDGVTVTSLSPTDAKCGQGWSTSNRVKEDLPLLIYPT